jgi:hypothetical protein
MHRLLLSAGLALALAGCSGEAAPTTRGVYLLMDTSGTYTKELGNAQAIINAILAKLEPGDSFAVARVDTGSFSEKDIVARVTFDERPSVTNQQKRKFRDEVDAFVKGVKPAAYTDITGGVLQAVEYLNEKDPGRKTILVSTFALDGHKASHLQQLTFFRLPSFQHLPTAFQQSLLPRPILLKLEDGALGHRQVHRRVDRHHLGNRVDRPAADGGDLVWCASGLGQMCGRRSPQVSELQAVRDAGGSGDLAEDAQKRSRCGRIRSTRVLVDDDRTVSVSSEHDHLALSASSFGVIERDLQLPGHRDRHGRPGLLLLEHDHPAVVLRPAQRADV